MLLFVRSKPRVIENDARSSAARHQLKSHNRIFAGRS
jgi:hypothetical protein